jgi:ATP-dependent phosphofructokinase / diphosphate-dependent phosphofructokinase
MDFFGGGEFGMATTGGAKTVGILTGGGDAPGLNAVIRGVALPLLDQGWKVAGVLDGWRGMIDGHSIQLKRKDVEDIAHLGGTILGSSRTNPYKKEDKDVPRVIENFKKLGLNYLVAVGGDDTLEIAYYLHRGHHLPIIGVPKTIDNDVLATDFTFGFMSAVEGATQDFDRLRTTTQSHRRVMVVECMGRHAGWITAFTGMASSADFIAVPEKPCTLQSMADALKRTRQKGKTYNMVAVAEGASIAWLEPYIGKSHGDEERDAFGNVKIQSGDLCIAVAKGIEALTGFETRFVALGHLQRGGSPCAYDRVLGTRYGLGASRAILAGMTGVLIAFENQKFVIKPFAGALRDSQKDAKKYKLLDMDFMKDAEELCI